MNKYRASTGCSQTIRVDVVVRIKTFKSKTVLSFQVNIKSEMRSFKSNENIHKKEGVSYYVS